MAEDILWRFGRALQLAVNERRIEVLAPLIDENVDWSIFGPVDMFPFLGPRQGKEAVLEVCRQISDQLTVTQCERESAIYDQGGGAGALILRLTVATNDQTARPISLRLANFARFANDRLTNLRAVIDTFDLVEQTLGHEIHLPRFA